MASIINTNISSLTAQRNLGVSQAALATSMARLSSGLRINSAKDDAAGLAISERMTAQVRGVSQAARNANDGISLAQTAEGDLAQIANNLQRIRELAVQAANGSNSTSDRVSLNNEATALIAENDRLASTSAFNGIKLLDGTFTGQTFQVGANGTSNDFVTVESLASARASSLGVGSGSSYSSKVSGATIASAVPLAAGDIQINGYTVGAAASDGVSNNTSDTSGIAVAAAINAISGNTKVTASVSATLVPGVAVTGYTNALSPGDVKINGVDIGGIGAATSAASRGGQMAAAINAKTSQTGVTATFDQTTGAVALHAAEGRNIEVTTTAAASSANTGLGVALGTLRGIAPSNLGALGATDITILGVALGAITAALSPALRGAQIATAINSNVTINPVLVPPAPRVTAVADSVTGAVTLFAPNPADLTVSLTGAATAASTGLGVDKAVATGGGTAVTAPVLPATTVPQVATGDLIINGVDIGFVAATTTPDLRGKQMVTAINAKTALTGVTATADATGALTLSANYPADISVTGTGVPTVIGFNKAATPLVTRSSTARSAPDVTRSAVTLTSSSSQGIAVSQLNVTGSASAGLADQNATVTAMAGAGVSSIDLTTADGARLALASVDSAINTINSTRAALGSYQARFVSVVASLATTGENLTASRSRIQDADFAAETAALARAQILQQAGTAMVAQANQLPQGVMALLRQ